MRKKVTLTLGLILACATSFVSAQTNGARTSWSPASIAQHRVSYLTTVLSLTPEQQQQANTIYTSAAASAQSLRSQMKTAHQGLQAAIQKNDVAAINQFSTAIGGLVAKQTLDEATAKAALYQSLTAEQQSKLTQLEGQHRAMGMMHGGF